jgi:RNA polymerase sigma factor (sigma-70 family)
VHPTERSDTDLVLAARSNDGEAFGELFDRWFNSSWNVARNIVRQDDLAADVAQDALLTAWQKLDTLDNPDAFGGWLLRITRNRALNRLQREQRSTAAGDDVVSGLRDQGLPDPTGAERPLGPDKISEVRDRQELVWAASAALGERDASLLDLHLRHGLGPAEIAEELGVEANNAHQQLYRLRTKLGDAIGSYLLWRNGRPLCDGLAAAVSGDVAFDSSVAKAVARHQKSCDYCSDRRAALIDPSKLFAAVPMVLVPPQLKLQAASGLQSAGISFGNSSGSATGGSAGNGAASGRPSSRLFGNESEVVLPGASGGHHGASRDGAGSHGASRDGGAALRNALTGPRSAADGLSRPAKKALLAGAASAGVAVILALLFVVGNGGDDDTVVAIDSEASNSLAGPDLSPSQGDEDDSDDGPTELDPTAPSADDGPTADTDPAIAPPDPGSGPAEAPEAPAPAAAAPDDQAADDTAPGGTEPPEDTDAPTDDDPDSDDTDPPGDANPPDDTDPGDDNDPPGSSDPGDDNDPPGSSDPSDDNDPPGGSDPPGDDPDPGDTDPSDGSGGGTPPPPPPPPADPPEAPVIVRFIGERPGGILLCPERTQGPFEAQWSTEHVESVILTMPSGGTHKGGPEGSHKFCGVTGDRITLVATGPGGETKATVVL